MPQDDGEEDEEDGDGGDDDGGDGYTDDGTAYNDNDNDRNATGTTGSSSGSDGRFSPHLACSPRGCHFFSLGVTAIVCRGRRRGLTDLDFRFLVHFRACRVSSPTGGGRTKVRKDNNCVFVCAGGTKKCTGSECPLSNWG